MIVFTPEGSAGRYCRLTKGLPSLAPMKAEVVETCSDSAKAAERTLLYNMMDRSSRFVACWEEGFACEGHRESI